MNRATSEELFRQAAEAEGGAPVSAGARVGHIRDAIEAARMVAEQCDSSSGDSDVSCRPDGRFGVVDGPSEGDE
jgi:hypothetical protein